MDNKLIMLFKDQTQSFTNGFECGQIWSKMEQCKPFFNYMFHTENTKQIEMMCQRFHYSFRAETINETWSSLYAEITSAN